MDATELDERVELERTRRHPPSDRGELAGYSFDLTAHEQRRLAAVYAARLDFDPAAALADEALAHRMLYSNLDAEQRATYRLLVDAGVLEPGALDA